MEEGQTFVSRPYPVVGEMHKETYKNFDPQRNDRAKHRLSKENHLYACIYDVLRSDIPNGENLPTFQRYKAKLVRLHAKEMERI
jgi:hypothetical protein